MLMGEWRLEGRTHLRRDASSNGLTDAADQSQCSNGLTDVAKGLHQKVFSLRAATV